MNTLNNRSVKTEPSKSPVTQLLYSKREAAQMLGVSVRTVENLIALKQLAVRRIGRRVLIPYTAILEFIRTDHRIERAA